MCWAWDGLEKIGGNDTGATESKQRGGEIKQGQMYQRYIGLYTLDGIAYSSIQ